MMRCTANFVRLWTLDISRGFQTAGRRPALPEGHTSVVRTSGLHRRVRLDRSRKLRSPGRPEARTTGVLLSGRAGLWLIWSGVRRGPYFGQPLSLSDAAVLVSPTLAG